MITILFLKKLIPNSRIYNVEILGVMDKINGFSEDLFANGQK